MDRDTRDTDIDDLLAEFEATIADLKAELDMSTDRSTRRDSPTENFLEVTDEYIIPATIAMFEANIRALERCQRAIRRFDRDRPRRRRGMRDQAADISDETLTRLDTVLAEIESILTESDLAQGSTARGILEDARRLNSEIRDRISSPKNQETKSIKIDVESELESIKDDVDAEESDSDE